MVLRGAACSYKRMPDPLHDRRPVDIFELECVLRAALGLEPPPDTSVDGVRFEVIDVDVRAWISWAIACLPAFAGGLPRLPEVAGLARGHLAAVAMRRARGNITRAAKLVRVNSRRSIREALDHVGLLPWPKPRKG